MCADQYRIEAVSTGQPGHTWLGPRLRSTAPAIILPRILPGLFVVTNQTQHLQILYDIYCLMLLMCRRPIGSMHFQSSPALHGFRLVATLTFLRPVLASRNFGNV